MKRIPKALRALVSIALLATAFYPAIGQPPSPPPAATAPPAADAAPAPAFLIADVHALPHSKSTHMGIGMVNHDRFLVHHATMLDMITLAYSGNGMFYGIKIVGGPSWLESNRYEVAALAPRDTQFPDLKLMLRGLLADRFKLVTHTADTPQPAYVMTAPKGASKLKQSTGAAQGCKSALGPDAKPAPETPVTFSCRGESMAAFAEFINQFSRYNYAQPLVDATGLKGLWDFDIELPTTQPRNSPESASILKAVDVLGLNIAAGTSPQPAILIDSVNEQPTPNPSGVDAAMPPLPPAEFEVATIKPTPPDSKGGFGGSSGSQLNFRGITLRSLISFAWQLNDDQMIANPPKWIDEDKFDITAKVAVPDTPAGAAAGPSFDGEEMPQMIRKLVEERFVIKAHMEDHPTDAYALVVDSPKMKAADPQGRTGCKEGPGLDGKDPRLANPILGRLLACQHVTMAQFAEALQMRSNGYIKLPVFDATGLPGAYDFVLSFSGYSQVGGINAYSLPQTPGSTASSDPTGGVTLFDALKQQLGLKLEKQKHSFPMLVLDSINRKPTDN